MMGGVRIGKFKRKSKKASNCNCTAWTNYKNKSESIYRIITPVYTFKKNKQEWKTEDYEILKTASIPEVIFCLIDIYKAVSG